MLKLAQKIGLSVIISTLVFSIPAHAENTLFTDVELGHENFIAIKYLKDKELIEGYEDGSFQPLQEINRAEALKIIMLAFPDSQIIEEPVDGEPAADPIFPDVTADKWYYSYIASSYNNEIINGYPDGYFHPENTINRAEALKMVILQEGGPLPISITEPPYTDVPVSAWFAPYAQVSAERTLILRNRYSSGLSPEQNLNRASFAELIYRTIMSQRTSVFARATWYGNEFADWGTASGVPFDPDALTAAHKTLPFGTMLEVVNLANGQKVVVEVNDRGPYAGGMDLDLSRAAFEEIGSLGSGIINVEFKERPNVSEYAF
ncbi:septal ring lytic transglycosylase RlpA family protein [Pseudomonadota bacterium]